MARADPYALFRAKAPGIMRKLLDDFPIVVYDAGAIVGNLGHECNGFKSMQEAKPLIPGSRGGYGWAQWTGPRRRAFEAWCARKGFKPSSDEANYSFLYRELIGTEKAAIPAVKAADGLYNKVVAFEKAFLRAGIKHYPSRLRYAEMAIEAFRKEAAHAAEPPRPAPADPNANRDHPPVPPPPDIEPPMARERPSVWQWLKELFR